MLRSQFAPLVVSLALAAGLLAGAPAGAEPEKSCGDQIAALCPDSEPNSPERRACVKEKRSQLSEECQKRLGPPPVTPADAAGLSGLRPLVTACSKDQATLGKYCTGPKASGDALLQCIVDHKSEMSADCVAVAEKALKQPAPTPPSGAGGAAK